MTGKRLPRVRLDLDSPRPEAIKKYIRGRCDYYAVEPGLACRVDDGVVRAPFRELSTPPNRQLLLQFRLKSPSAVRYDAEARQQRLAPHFALVQMVPGSSKEESFELGQRDCVITLHCQPSYLEKRLHTALDGMPAWLQDFLRGEEQNRHSIFRLSAAMRSAANDILNADPDGFFFDLLLHAKCEELLWHSLLALCDESGTPARVAGLSNAETDKIELAATQLREHFPDLPSLVQLAEELQLSSWKLNRGFKAVHGMTASEFIVDLRMHRARELLAESRLSIQAIAMEVGYDYLSNFSKAFKRHLGVSPRDYRDAL
ncbi:MAG: AraC family transcriptional regulator [Halioglobus sp.]